MPLPAQTPVTPAPAATPPPGASQPGDKTFSQGELDQLLAPIALYPDALLAQVLMASTYPLAIVEAARWVKANPGLKDKALEDALLLEPFPGGAIEIERIVAQGSAAHVLLDAAEDADLLVVGSRGRGGFTGLLLGSVSHQVASHATCPVVVVRD
jgi:nucleotide-binding universal stress UspA family protein